MNDHKPSILKRIRRYNFEDGTIEMLIGLIYFWAGVFFKPLPVPNCPISISIIGFIVTIFLAACMRQRYVYPRSGYVNAVSLATGKSVRTFLLSVLLGTVIAVSIFIPFFLMGRNGDGGLSWLTLTFGLVIGIVLILQGFWLGFPRLAVVGLISAGLAVLLSPIVFAGQTYIFSNQQFPYWVVPAWQIFFPVYFLLMAPVLLLSGGIAFLNYLHNNPPLAEDPDEQ
ncbi:MAG: hypothetical protein JXB85_07770 [Anaerolineales bacterium]|nr:hypothetical protein [Anaerolineales bacterium]